MIMKKESNPLVSVIVIAYQSEKYILDVLESIKDQSWDNIDLVISDDASTDSTLQLCKDWIEINKDRFTNNSLLTVQKNSGIPANCSRGLSVAKGEWIKFIAADDLLLPNCISDNMDTSYQNPDISFLISDIIEIDEMGDIIRESPLNYGLNYFMENQKSKENKLKAYARWPAFLNTPSFFYKYELIKDSFNISLDLKIFEDTSLIFEIIDKGAKILYLKKPTVKYRIHNNSISRSAEFYKKREIEAYDIFKNYRKKYLSIFNPIDLSVIYESWLRFNYKGIMGFRGDMTLRKLSLFYWQLKLQEIKINYLRKTANESPLDNI